MARSCSVLVVEPEHAPFNGRNGRKRPQPPQKSPREVADELRARIRSGRLQPGRRMPTQARLAEEFGVERGTVRQALRILQSERLLTNVSRGSPATVAPDPYGTRAAPQTRPLPTTVALASRVTRAFAAPHVEIDALCLTAVSLTLALGEPLGQIHAGRLKPAKIDVRVLLPSRDIDLAFPVAVAGAGATGDPVHERWLAMRDAQARVLRHSLLGLRATHGIDVRVSFRALPFTPPVKLYLLNGSEALFAYYTLTRREQEVGRERLETYDAEGIRSTLFAFERGGGPRDGVFVQQSRLWFEALWGTISSGLVLGARPSPGAGSLGSPGSPGGTHDQEGQQDRAGGADGGALRLDADGEQEQADDAGGAVPPLDELLEGDDEDRGDQGEDGHGLPPFGKVNSRQPG